ncbi:MAG: DUF302 domain-containing protein [Burkholderiales bacterium]|nr:DUF302 domain-containing protein [Burkholderiales bacterium]
MRHLSRVLAVATLVAATQVAIAADDGVVRVKSAYPMAETIARIKKDVAAKGIRFFDEIDQSKLAADAGIKVLPSTLLVFGNPPLGTQFIAARPAAGLDWPVRLLVQQDEQGVVWAVYTDFGWLARRHEVNGEAARPFETASGVIGSITSSVKGN